MTARAPFVISVGGLELGGCGKTPVTMEIARRLLERGLRVAILSRGYRGGDEARLCVQRLPAVHMATGNDRSVLVSQLSGRCDVAVLDDGFQHRRCPRDLDILVQDPAAPTGWIVRERATASGRADVLWWHRRDGADPPNILAAPLAGACAPAQISSRFRLRGTERLAGSAAFLLCAIARPRAVCLAIRRAGILLVGQKLFRDHHWFTDRQLGEADARARKSGADYVLTTEKDRVRIAVWPGSLRLRTLIGDVEVVHGRTTLDEILARVCAN